jgi:hypothetical protein
MQGHIAIVQATHACLTMSASMMYLSLLTEPNRGPSFPTIAIWPCIDAQTYGHRQRGFSATVDYHHGDVAIPSDAADHIPMSASMMYLSLLTEPNRGPSFPLRRFVIRSLKFDSDRKG